MYFSEDPDYLTLHPTGYSFGPRWKGRVEFNNTAQPTVAAHSSLLHSALSALDPSSPDTPTDGNLL